MNYELLVFDWDGTLIDSAGAIVACIQGACRDLGLPVPDHAVAVSHGAHPKRDRVALEPLACVENIAELRQWLTRNT